VTHAWRLVKSKHVATAFTGIGARLAGGRWNEAGTAVVYVSGSLSLAVLELFVHLSEKSRTTLQLVTIQVEIPGHLIAGPPPLPAGWRGEPPPAASRAVGTEWVRSGASCALRVPSAIIPTEPNYVLNPAHPDFPEITYGPPEPFSLDPRLWK
jgi:RES domain-containing protein